MPTTSLAALVLVLPAALLAAETSVFRAYVDSDLCARLMLGPITPSRIERSQTTVKDGSEPVVVHLHNNMVLTVNKEKMIRPLAGQLVEISGEIKANNGTVKLQSANVITGRIRAAERPGAEIAGRSDGPNDANAHLREKIRHELAMMPYISEFDFISFTQSGPEVILYGLDHPQHKPAHRLQCRQRHRGRGDGYQQH